jgi:hypothetical protein
MRKSTLQVLISGNGMSVIRNNTMKVVSDFVQMLRKIVVYHLFTGTAACDMLSQMCDSYHDAS